MRHLLWSYFVKAVKGGKSKGYTKLVLGINEKELAFTNWIARIYCSIYV